MSKRIPKTTGEFGASMGFKVKLITIIFLVSELGVFFPLLWLFVLKNAPPPVRILVTASLALTPLVIAMFMIRGYSLRSDGLIISRLFWKNRILLEDLEAAEFISEASRHAIKLMGNGGLFAIHGKFKNKELGYFQAFITDPAKSVVLKFPKRTVVVSPDNPDRFVRYLGLGEQTKTS